MPHVVWNSSKSVFRISGQIVLAKLEDRPIKVSDQGLLVGVDLWPLLIFELEVEHLT